MADQSTYGWRVPSLADPPDGPSLAQNLADDVARDLARAAPDPTVLGASNGSGTGISVTGNYVTGSMGDLLAVPGSLVVPAGWSALVRMDLSCDFLLSAGYAATARFYTNKDGTGWGATAFAGAWGAFVKNDDTTLQRTNAKPWTEYKVCDAGAWQFKVVAGSNNGTQVRGYLVKADVVLLTMYPPGVTAAVPGGGDGAIPA